MKNMMRGQPALFKSGTKHMTGTADAVVRNIEACRTLAKMTRTSLGPHGMNKMVINHLDKLFVTSDSATILKEIDVEHPAAKMIVMAAQQQDYECGDNSNFVVVLAGELMSQAEGLLRMGLHPADIVRGYGMAGVKALEIMSGLTCFNQESFTEPKALAQACFTAICSKQYGNEAILCDLIGKACAAVMPSKPSSFNVDNVRVCKVHGGSLHQSEVLMGVVVGRAPDGTTLEVNQANVAVFVESIDTSTTDTKGTVALNSARELLDYSIGEEKLIQSMIEALAAIGCNAVVTGGKISEMALHFLNKNNILALRVTSKFELRRLARSLNANLNLNIQTPVSAEDLGYCSKAYIRDVGAQTCTVFQQGGEKDATRNQHSVISTIILRGSTENYLNDFERAIEDGVNVVRAVCKSPAFTAGGGACELAVSAQLLSYATSCVGLEQYAIKAYADAMAMFPRTLAQNAGLDATQILAKLYSAHERGDSTVGVNIEGDSVSDMRPLGVYDHLDTKLHALKLATDVATTVLSVDQIIMAKPAGGPKAPKGQGHWDDRDE
uniref:CCT-theta n=1 Tax=Spongospora subterranea TaxID=70186 RepID=A0A0H5R7X4_9EUKA|eukprot:CRZ09817.1 hypothetical protein [Spongospora subterranea]